MTKDTGVRGRKKLQLEESSLQIQLKVKDYLRLLLNHVKGPMSFHDLQCFNGIETSSFREATLLRGLLESDNSFEECLQEASQYQMPQSLRRLFATILVYCNPSNPKILWEKFEDAMSKNYNHIELSSNKRKAKVLANINSVLQSMGKKFTDYAFVDIDIKIDERKSYSKEVEEELNISVSEQDVLAVYTLNKEQKQAYNIILQRIFSHDFGAFFIDGPGGTRKTYMYCALLSTVRSRGFIALATSTSGVAASILPAGRTTHSRFKIPLNIEEIKSCRVSKQGNVSQLTQMAKLIIWGEASMAKKEAIEAFNQMLQDIIDSQVPFGGQVVIFGRDFRQVLPIVPRTNRHEAIKATVVTSQLWPTLQKIKLTENMRARFDPSFSEFLLRVGNGTENVINNDKIRIPNTMIIPFKDEMTSMADLIEATFLDLEKNVNNSHFMAACAILTPKSNFVDKINDLLINRFPGSAVKYYSFDSAIYDTEQLPQEEFLNSITPNGLPSHELILKVNCPIMLLRNIDPPMELFNGTRLVCQTFTKNLIDAEIIASHYCGKRVFIPRIPLQPAENDRYPFIAIDPQHRK